MAADRFSINKSWDHVQSKFVGTGHSDITKFEWASNQHRYGCYCYIGGLSFPTEIPLLLISAIMI